MSLHPVTSIAEHVSCKDACSSANSGAPSLITAAGTGDNVKVTGQTIDRFDATSGGLAHSCVVSTAYLAALDATETLSLAHEYQTSANGSTWDTAVAIQTATVKATGGTGGSNERGTDEHTLSLVGLKRYVRFNVTPDLSRAGTDTATFHTQCILGGFDQLPT
jgi:hypothetical protein